MLGLRGRSITGAHHQGDAMAGAGSSDGSGRGEGEGGIGRLVALLLALADFIEAARGGMRDKRSAKCGASSSRDNVNDDEDDNDDNDGDNDGATVTVSVDAQVNDDGGAYRPAGPLLRWGVA